jgi:hypothetical protein
MAYSAINHESSFLMFSIVLLLLIGEAIGGHYRGATEGRYMY